MRCSSRQLREKDISKQETHSTDFPSFLRQTTTKKWLSCFHENNFESVWKEKEKKSFFRLGKVIKLRRLSVTGIKEGSSKKKPSANYFFPTHTLYVNAVTT